MYESKLLLQGLLPYRDFFHAHAPFHLLAVFLTRILTGGDYLPAFRLAPMLFTLFSGCLVYRTVRRGTDIPFAIIACLLYLFTYRVITHSVHFMGWNLLVLFLLIALDQYLSRRMFSAGIALGCATMTNLLGGVGLYAFLVLLPLLRDWQSIKRIVLGFCMVVIPVLLFCFAISGTEFINNVFLYQVSKPPNIRFPRFSVIGAQIQNARYIFILTLISFLPLLWDKKSALYRSRPLANLLWLGSFTLIFLLLLPRPYSYYFVTVLPFAAMAAGYGIAWVFERYRIGGKRQKILFGTAATICMFFILQSTIPSALRFWGLRMSNHENFGITYTIARSVDELIPAGEPIHGTFSTTPLVALLTGRRISGNETDTSTDRFRSGVTDFEEFIRNIEADTPGGILTIKGGAIAGYEPYMEYVHAHYKQAVLFHVPGKAHGAVTLWIRDEECEVPLDELSREK